MRLPPDEKGIIEDENEGSAEYDDGCFEVVLFNNHGPSLLFFLLFVLDGKFG